MAWETRTSSSRIHDSYSTKKLEPKPIINLGYGCMYVVVFALLCVVVLVLRTMGVM